LCWIILARLLPIGSGFGTFISLVSISVQALFSTAFVPAFIVGLCYVAVVAFGLSWSISRLMIRREFQASTLTLAIILAVDASLLLFHGQSMEGIWLWRYLAYAVTLFCSMAWAGAFSTYLVSVILIFAIDALNA
jgi:hypothetical protein